MIKHLNFRISEQKLEVKYMEVILQEHLGWNTHTNNLNTKLNRAIGLLASHICLSNLGTKRKFS